MVFVSAGACQPVATARAPLRWAQVSAPVTSLGEWQPGKVRQGMATQYPASPAPGPPLRFVPTVGSLKKNFVRSLQSSLFAFQPAGLTFPPGPRALCRSPAGRAGGEGPWPGVRGASALPTPLTGRPSVL